MEFDPFFTKVEGCVAVGSLPEEGVLSFGGFFAGSFHRFSVRVFYCLAGRRTRRRGEDGTIVEVHVRQLQAYAHEVLHGRVFFGER